MPASVGVVCVEFPEKFLVEGRATRLCDCHIVSSTDLLDLLTSGVKRVLVETETLDADLSVLVDTVSNGPLDNAEVDTISLAGVQAQVEALGVKQVTTQANGESLAVGALVV